MSSKYADENRRVCDRYVTTGGRCEASCKQIHPADLLRHNQLRIKQYDEGKSYPQSMRCTYGDQCNNFQRGACSYFHGQDVRDHATIAQSWDRYDDDVATVVSQEHIVHQSDPELHFRYNPSTRPDSQSWLHTPSWSAGSPLDPAKRGNHSHEQGTLEFTVPYIYPYHVESYNVKEITTTVGLAGLVVKQGNNRLMVSALQDLPKDKRMLLEYAMLDAFEGWPLVFFAVHASRKDLVRYFIENGTSPNILSPTGIPLLAFVILSDENIDMPNMVQVMVDLGADTSVIPIVDGKGGVQCIEWMGKDRWEIEIKFDKKITDEVRDILLGPERARSTMNFPPLRPTQIKATTATPSHLLQQPQMQLPRVIVLSSDMAIEKAHLESILSALNVDSVVLSSRTMEKIPELCPKYSYDPHKIQKHGYMNIMPIEEFVRPLQGRAGILAFHNIIDCVHFHSTSFRELARLWKSGVCQSKRDGQSYTLTNVTLLLTLQLDNPVNPYSAVFVELNKYFELRDISALITSAVHWSKADTTETVQSKLADVLHLTDDKKRVESRGGSLGSQVHTWRVTSDAARESHSRLSEDRSLVSQSIHDSFAPHTASTGGLSTHPQSQNLDTSSEYRPDIAAKSDHLTLPGSFSRSDPPGITGEQSLNQPVYTCCIG